MTDRPRPGEYGTTVAADPDVRRLWLFSLICATAGALTIQRTGSLAVGVFVFLACVVVLGPLLWIYEKRRPG